MSAENDNPQAVGTAQGADIANNECLQNSIADHKLDIDLKHSRAFLKRLDPTTKEFCFRTFDDNKARADKTLARKFNGTLEQHYSELKRLNAAGAGVFVVINHGGQTGLEIDRVRATFGDTDGAPLEPLLVLKPHMVVQSSPGKWHVFWLTADGFPLRKFTTTQEAIAAKFGTDPAVKDLPRVMRLPGFNHCKAGPFPVRISKYEKNLPFYTAEQITEGLGLTIGATGNTKEPKPADVPAYMLGRAGNISATITPETPEAVERMQSALFCIPPDCNRDTYRQVVWAIVAHGWRCCGGIARNWATGSAEKYDERDFQGVINSFDPKGGTGAGTLYHLAKLHGWTETLPKVSQPPNTADTLANTEPGDMQAARVFATINKGKLLFVSQAGRWMRWDSARWAWCGIGEEMEAAKRTADAFLVHCIQLVRQDAERHKKRLAFALRLQNLPRLDAMLRLAQSEPGMSVGTMGELDSNPWLLGVQNGVVDLKTGACLAPDPSMLMTRQAGALYDRGAECPRWLAFLDSVMEGDIETIGFIRRALGYTLTGITTEEILFICYGFGANGKSVFSNVVSRILGEYSQMAPPSLLTARRDGDSAPRNDIARLCGARGLQINELNHGDRLDEQVVKMLAGREQLSARFLHREFFDFWPTAKPWLRTNHRPIVTGDDDGIWRRLALIPFKRKYAENERNPWLEQQLMEESAGILAWMVEGCLEWQRVGLAPSPLVRSESASYRTESDLLGEFLQDACINEANARELQTATFARWRNWCDGNGLRCGAKASFTRKLSERGFKETRSNGARYYTGLKIRI